MGIFQVMHLVKGTSDLRQLGLQVIDQTLDLGQQGCVAGLRLGQDAFLGVSLPWRGKVGFIMMTPLSPDCQELCCLKLYQWKGNIPLLPGQDLSYLNTEKQPQYPAQEQSFRLFSSLPEAGLSRSNLSSGGPAKAARSSTRNAVLRNSTRK
uniref:Uncharacterized protein n=1 Tax=Rousettus aegyptiacus TaxID=9407 RepID=A0A7J8GBD2_ROUAE|nr:hypothetical protein HJG63_011696 [Rousettus aegyptiacus]